MLLEPRYRVRWLPGPAQHSMFVFMVLVLWCRIGAWTNVKSQIALCKNPLFRSKWEHKPKRQVSPDYRISSRGKFPNKNENLSKFWWHLITLQSLRMIFIVPNEHFIDTHIWAVPESFKIRTSVFPGEEGCCWMQSVSTSGLLRFLHCSNRWSNPLPCFMNWRCKSV